MIPALPPAPPGPEVTRRLGNLLQATVTLDPSDVVSTPALLALTDDLDLPEATQVIVADRLLQLAAMAGALARTLNEPGYNLALLVDRLTDWFVARSNEGDR